MGSLVAHTLFFSSCVLRLLFFIVCVCVYVKNV